LIHTPGVVCVSDGDTPYQRVVADVPEEWVIALDEQADTAGKSRADLIRTAIREYLDQDRAARLEADLSEVMSQLDRIEGTLSDADTHTHTSNMSDEDQSDTTTEASKTVERTLEIADRLNANHGSVLDEQEVKRAVKDIAGGDPRTVRKYLGELKERDHVYEHPADGSSRWYLSRNSFLDDLAAHLQGYMNPQRKAAEILGEYPFDTADALEDCESPAFNEVIANED